MPPPVRAPWAPTSTRCFLFGHRLTFLLDETLLLADVECVTSWGDLVQTTNGQDEPTCLRGERDTVSALLPGHQPANSLGATHHPSWAVAIITEKKRRWKCWRESQELILAKSAPWGRLVPPMGSPCNGEGIKQAGAASSDSTSKLGTGGKQPPCSRGDTPWKWQRA